MVKALAGLPDDKRQTMMTDRLTMFAEMADAERKSAMSQMMAATETLPDVDKKKLLRTRFEVLAAFAPDRQMKLMGTHMGLLQEKGQSAMMQEMQLTQAVMPDLSANAKAVVKQMMESMGGGMGMGGGMQMGGGMSMSGMAREEPKQKPWWKFW
ncbi:MAG: hypothetical protein HY259_09080 [Chloroflexi bacterium]|nr:hypothetical protein [Chloroflexota bacterium]